MRLLLRHCLFRCTTTLRHIRHGRWLLAGMLLLSVLPLGLSVLLLETQPLLTPQQRLSADDQARARRVLDYGARSARQLDVLNTLTLDAVELNATANYVLKHITQGDVHLVLRTGRLRLLASLPFNALPWPLYINIAIDWAGQGNAIAVQKLRIGDANLPALWWEAAVALAQQRSSLAALWMVAEHTVQNVTLADHRIDLTYRWDDASLERLRGVFLEVAGKRRLRHYHARLVEVLNASPTRRVELSQLLQALFSLAESRSRENDPVEENRAALLVIGAYLTGGKIAPALALQYSDVVAQRRTVLLRKRLDLAKHFSLSAVLAATANTTLADLAGVAKEIDDSHGGSGFNFQDLAADRAGTRLGQLAVASADDARRVQIQLSQSVDEAGFMPVVKDLPEQLDARAFALRFGEIGSPEFEKIRAEIERRLDQLPLYAADS